MDNLDRENLQFLLSANEVLLSEWYDRVTPDERVYAYKLLCEYREELQIKLSLIESEEVTHVTESSEYLKKFLLK